VTTTGATVVTAAADTGAAATAATGAGTTTPVAALVATGAALPGLALFHISSILALKAFHDASSALVGLTIAYLLIC